ncbi:MAG: peptidoglycan DD-metalloendopeptidase family protein [Defluviitaleaceae bacterium]|nr:peptidoglycan DD-metalloendopeptidase family protein [Defluviitaleaceae bacterium]
MTEKYIADNFAKLLPIMGDDFEDAPLYFPLSDDSKYFDLFINASQKEIQELLDRETERHGKKWSISGYLENRANGLRNYPQMIEQGRFYHLGIDINAPCGTKLYAPYDCGVALKDYDAGEGNYGGFIVLKCHRPESGIFYMLFGHLNPNKLPPLGAALKKGDKFAEFGSMDENGNWFHHAHLQILTQKAFDEGWAYKGYCTEAEVATIDEYCPDPFLFL